MAGVRRLRATTGLWLAAVSVVGSVGAAEAPAQPASLTVSAGWRFMPDPDNVGLRQRWDGISLDDSSWTLTDTGGPWEARGAPGYDGVGWYRKWIDLPAPWPRVGLLIPEPADRLDLFVQGTPVARGLSRCHPGSPYIARDISALVGGGTRFLVALRIVNEVPGSPGGFSGSASAPLTVTTDLRAHVSTDEGWLDYLAQAYPRQPWPDWLRGRGAAWLTVGHPGKAGRARVGLHGQFAPHGQEFAVSCWVYDPSAERFYAPEAQDCKLRLEDRVLPLPQLEAKAGRFNLMTRYWTQSLDDFQDAVLGVGEVTIQNTTDRPRDVDLLVAVHPFGPRGERLALESIAYDPKSRLVAVNGRPAVVLSSPPTRFAAAPFGRDGTVAFPCARGSCPEESAAEDPRSRMASGAAVYRLRIQPYGARTHTYRLFLSGGPDVLSREAALKVARLGRKSSHREAIRAWAAAPGGTPMRLRLRDKTLQYAWYAGLNQLLLGLPTLTQPADAVLSEPATDAVAVAAFARAGMSREAAVIAGRYADALAPEREYEDGPLPVAFPGIGIHVMLEAARLSPDPADTERFYPAVLRACRAMQRERYGRLARGGRPPVKGPPDALGAAAWVLRGWRLAGWAAERLHRPEDAGWIREQELLARREVRRELSRRFEPGAVAFLWPCGLSEAGLASVRAGVAGLWESWCEPFVGGCRIDARARPSFSLSLAHAALTVGRYEWAERILDEVLGHQTVPGAYSWAREVDPATFRHAGGPLPDPAAGAELVCLLRAFFLGEDGDALHLTPWVPGEWVKPGRRLEVKDAPTRFGTFPGYSLVSSPQGVDFTLLRPSEEAAFSPPGGVRWRIPGGRVIRQITVDRTRLEEIPQDRWIDLPAGVRRVRVFWGAA